MCFFINTLNVLCTFICYFYCTFIFHLYTKFNETMEILPLSLMLLLAHTFFISANSKKLSLFEYDENEISRVFLYNQTRIHYGLKPIYYSSELMSLAQRFA